MQGGRSTSTSGKMADESLAGSLSTSLAAGYESWIKLKFFKLSSIPVDAILAVIKAVREGIESRLAVRMYSAM